MLRGNCAKHKLTVLKWDELCQVCVVLTSSGRRPCRVSVVHLYSHFPRAELVEMNRVCIQDPIVPSIEHLNIHNIYLLLIYLHGQVS